MIEQIHNWLTARGGFGQLPKLLSLLFGVGPGYRTDLMKLARSISLLYRRNGATFTVNYLKEAVRCVMQYSGGNKVRACDSTVFVGLSGGLPTIIPGRLRTAIRTGHTALQIAALSVLGVYRGLVIPGVLKVESITGPFTGQVDGFVGFTLFLPKFFSYLPCLSLGRPSLWLSTSIGPAGVRASIGALKDAYCLLFVHKDVWAHLKNFVELAYGVGTRRILQLAVTFLALVYRFLSKAPIQNCVLSRLSRLEEAAGKIRIVAIVDYWTQWALKPLHRAIFNVLREIKQDGTFGQERCVDMLRSSIRAGLDRASAERNGTFSPDKTGGMDLIRYAGKGSFTAYSYDLSSATDRIPVHVYVMLLTELFGPVFATRWKAILTFREWRDTWKDTKSRTRVTEYLVYAVGQPMGAYSSWAMLALAHHAIVQYAAHLEGHQGWFAGYGIVGDDVVILDRPVAERYLAIVTGWGIQISMNKSIVSDLGTFEFCKRLVGPQGDLSGIPIGLIYQAVKSPVDSATLFAHVIKRGVALFPIAIARTLSFLSGVPPRYQVPIAKLRNEHRLVFAMLVQSGFPLWRGIALVHLLPSLTVEDLEEVLRTGKTHAASELGMYWHLERLAFTSFLSNLSPVNWREPLLKVAPEVNRLLGRSLPRDLAAWIALWATPIGWWLFKTTVLNTGRLVLYSARALHEAVFLPFPNRTVYGVFLFFIKRLRDRILEDYRGNALEYLTVINRAAGRTMFDVSFTSEMKERRHRRVSTWVSKSLKSFKGPLPPADDSSALV